MPGRIVEIAQDDRHLQAFRGFMQIIDVKEGRTELARIPLDDIDAVIGNAHGLSYSNNLLVALAERGVPFVLCAANHNAVGLLLAVDGNHQQAHRFDMQISAGKPMIKRLWASVVRSKLEWQGAVLSYLGRPDAPLLALARRVRSGDPDNIEAQGARRYWILLFGDSFRRDREANGINAMLNYGYTVLRATTARAIVAAGLHPSIGLHHRDGSNPMRLADDLMEPFRPLVDLCVHELIAEGHDEVTSEVKRRLVQVMYSDLINDAGLSPLSVCVQRLATSVAQVFSSDRNDLDFPNPLIPVELAGSSGET